MNIAMAKESRSSWTMLRKIRNRGSAIDKVSALFDGEIGVDSRCHRYRHCRHSDNYVVTFEQDSIVDWMTATKKKRWLIKVRGREYCSERSR